MHTYHTFLVILYSLQKMRRPHTLSMKENVTQHCLKEDVALFVINNNSCLIEVQEDNLFHIHPHQKSMLALYSHLLHIHRRNNHH